MRKQTKLVAVASAAALLAVGASMTSFAATGWVEEDGQWFFYNKDGNRVEDTWKKSGDNWYWLDSEEGGAMAVDKLVDDDSDTYYVDSNGAMKTGWQKIFVHDALEDEDMEHWFYFKSNGKMEYNNTGETDPTKEKTVKEKKINGKRYGFDERGVMVSEWTVATKTDASQASTSSWKYFNSVEDGARVTKGWFKVIPANEDNSFSTLIENLSKTNTFDYDNADDETEKWYYADGDGNIKAGEIAKIKGKYYGFHPDGWMLNGLVFMSVDKDGKITIPVGDYKSVDSDELDDIIDDQPSNVDNCSLYYFGNDEDHDGVMRTGNTTVTLDGENYIFQFSKSGGVDGKGKGVTGMDDNKYIYKFGKRMKADTDDRYAVILCTGAVGDGIEVQEIDKKELRAVANDRGDVGTNKDGDTVHIAGTMPETYYLVNTSGAIVKTKKAAKDGDDWYFYVKNKRIRMYTNNKVLAPGTGENAGTIPGSYNSSSKWGLKDPIYAPEITSIDPGYKE